MQNSPEPDFNDFACLDFYSSVSHYKKMGAIFPSELSTPSFDYLMQCDFGYNSVDGSFVSVTGCTYIIDGVREKRDGQLATVFSLDATNYCMLDGSVRETDLLVGQYEFFQGKFYAFNRYNACNKVCKFGCAEFGLCYDEFVPVDSFFYDATKMEGVIVSVFGKQYKWKQMWTVDVAVDAVRGFEVSILGHWIQTEFSCLVGDIVELIVSTNTIYRKRPDKVIPQSPYGLLSAAPFSDFYSEIELKPLAENRVVLPYIACVCSGSSVVCSPEYVEFVRLNGDVFYAPTCFKCGRGPRLKHKCIMYDLKGYCYCAHRAPVFISAAGDKEIFDEIFPNRKYEYYIGRVMRASIVHELTLYDLRFLLNLKSFKGSLYFGKPYGCATSEYFYRNCIRVDRIFADKPYPKCKRIFGDFSLLDVVISFECDDCDKLIGNIKDQQQSSTLVYFVNVKDKYRDFVETFNLSVSDDRPSSFDVKHENDYLEVCEVRLDFVRCADVAGVVSEVCGFTFDGKEAGPFDFDKVESAVFGAGKSGIFVVTPKTSSIGKGVLLPGSFAGFVSGVV
jgi:hypothetical protein